MTPSPWRADRTSKSDVTRKQRRLVLKLGALPAASLVHACGGRAPPREPARVVFRHPKLFGDPRPLDTLLSQFEHEQSIRVRRVTLPASSDEQHLFYAINLQAKSTEFDVAALDTIWVAEFAHAGWLRPLDHLLPEQEREDLFPAVRASILWRNRVYALPWFADAGLLYYRKDLLAKHGYAAPTTWDDLVASARTILRIHPDLHGFVWQGKQYEGLVCNALEFIWSHGGDLGESQADAAARGLAFMRALVRDGVSPPFVTTLTEEPSRVIFGRGNAVFLRNWPYAWRLLEREGSAIRGRVGVSVLPHAPGCESASALGGWQLGVNAFSTNPQAAERLAAFLTTRAAHKALALAYGYSPPRRSLYVDADLAVRQPFLSALRTVLETARPRPVLAQYVALSQTLQWQFSAVLTGTRSPATALAAIRRAAASRKMG